MEPRHDGDSQSGFTITNSDIWWFNETAKPMRSGKMKILIVEDEEALASGLKFNFEQEGYDVTSVGDGTAAITAFQEAAEPFDLVILDLMLPRMSGYETCRQLRALDDHVPILVLSAKTLSEDKAEAFDCGTDQYMTKPFDLVELLSRVRNLIARRSAARAAERGEQVKPVDEFQFDDVHIDFRKYQVTVRGAVHELTSMELQLLRYFVQNEGYVLSRSQILEDVWGEKADITTRSIDNFVLRLRKLIERNPAEPVHILSIRGTGYRFVSSP